ncbi:hypothetical protein QUF75_01495 [Desulfococcaceae bacterium HSG7]|nr:hypothetical protein [Desulfococcaceae bacterium HSG7]
MTLKQLISDLPAKARFDLNLDHVRDFDCLKDAVITVMNTSGVSTGKGTHYNSKEEEMLARKNAGKALFEMDRGIFMMIHALDGVTDDSKRTAIKALLMNCWDNYGNSVLDRDVEMEGVRRLTQSLQANRALNLFVEMRKDRVNNTRTKKRLILPFLLNHPSLDWWAVKYRRKLRLALEHAWDKRTAGVIKSVIGRERTADENRGLRERIDRHLNNSVDRNWVYECISFILGNDGEYTLPLFKAFKAAKTDIAKGKTLPPEVLEGIRSTYHKSVSQKTILKLTRNTSMTEKKKALVQRKAKKENVKIAFNPMARTATELYVLAYAEGMTDAIWNALMKKARSGAQQLPVRFGKIGILVDDSFSMTGALTQKMRPMAIALAMKDVLINIGETFVIRTASGRRINRADPLPKPKGSTDLALALVELLETGADAVFILSDGYENAPSGRVNEVMELLNRIGAQTPVYHICPVVGSESGQGLRNLSDRIPCMPVSNPQGLALTMMRAMMEVDVQRGIQALAAITLPQIGASRLPAKQKEAIC